MEETDSPDDMYDIDGYYVDGNVIMTSLIFGDLLLTFGDEERVEVNRVSDDQVDTYLKMVYGVLADVMYFFGIGLLNPTRFDGVVVDEVVAALKKVIVKYQDPNETSSQGTIDYGLVLVDQPHNIITWQFRDKYMTRSWGQCDEAFRNLYTQVTTLFFTHLCTFLSLFVLHDDMSDLDRNVLLTIADSFHAAGHAMVDLAVIPDPVTGVWPGDIYVEIDMVWEEDEEGITWMS